MSDETIPREPVEQTAAGLRCLLDQVADGTMTAGSGTVARLEGAVAALEGLLAACGGAESRIGEDGQGGAVTGYPMQSPRPSRPHATVPTCGR